MNRHALSALAQYASDLRGWPPSSCAHLRISALTAGVFPLVRGSLVR
jgi:hypothetical protein